MHACADRGVVGVDDVQKPIILPPGSPPAKQLSGRAKLAPANPKPWF